MSMDINYILSELQKRLNSGTAMLTGKGHALGQADMITLAAVAVVGVLLCFLGLKLVRLWAAVTGLLAGFLGGTYLSANLGLEGYIPYIIGAVTGLVLLVLGIRFYRAGVFWVSWILGTAGSVFIIRPETLAFVLICVGIGLVIALITLKIAEPVMMLVTALFGGYAAGQAAYIMLPVHKNIINAAIIIAFIILGIIVQFLQESRKRKRQHLKKAEEIRNIHSTAKEVDKARAMMENLDGQVSVKDSAEPDKTDVPKVESDVLNLDNIADFDDDLDDDEY